MAELASPTLETSVSEQICLVSLINELLASIITGIAGAGVDEPVKAARPQQPRSETKKISKLLQHRSARFQPSSLPKFRQAGAGEANLPKEGVGV